MTDILNHDSMDWHVIKRNHLGQEVWRYPAQRLSEEKTGITLEAFFNLDDRDAGYVVYKRNDRFVETFYSDRWYNVFAIYDRDDAGFKGWYCNVTRPAVWDEQRKEVAADDLALDVWVYPTGETIVMDRDEFEALQLPQDEGEMAEAAVREILQRAKNGDLPK